MSEITTLARPYAKAIFELAQNNKNLDAWSAALSQLSEAVRHPKAKAFISHPQTTNTQIVEFLMSMIKDTPLEQNSVVISMLQLLADNKRLNVLPEICNLFENFMADAMKTQKVRVETFSALTEAQKKALIEKLNQRLNRQVSLEISINPALIGGAIIRAGDLVIDGSVKGQLEKLAQTLAA